MSLLQVNKKLRESRFFLSKMSERAQMAFGDKEEFDFYLSAFLCASRSVDYRLRHEAGDAYQQFYATWEANLVPDEQRILKFMVDDRNLEVHESGSRRAEQSDAIPVYSEYQDKSGKVTVSAPLGLSGPPAEILKPIYYFEVDGRQEEVLTVCEKYLDLLEGLVKDFENSLP